MQVALSGRDKLRLRPRSQARQDLPPLHIPRSEAPSMHTTFGICHQSHTIPPGHCLTCRSAQACTQQCF